MRWAWVIVCLGLAGCQLATSPTGPVLVARNGSQPAGAMRNPAQLQSEVRNLADDFIAAVADVYGAVESRSTDAQKLAFVQAQKTDLALGALSNAVNAYPFSGMMDLVVLITLARHSVEDPGTRRLLGDEDADVMLQMLRTQESIAWRLASGYLTPEQTAELRQLIARWREENPQQQYIAHVRLVDFLDSPSTASQVPRTPTSIFGLLFLDPMAGIDPAVRAIEQSRDTAERIFFYMQRMPTILSWQAEALYQRMLLAPQIRQVLDNSTAFTQTTARFSQATTQIAETTESFRQDLFPYRDQLIAQVQQALSTEREATIKQMTDSVSVQQQIAVTNMETSLHRLIDRFYAKMRWLALTAIGAALVAAIIYQVARRLVSPRKPPIDRAQAGTGD